MPHQKLSEYRQRASNVRTIAWHTHDPEMKQALADIANSWDALADDLEDRNLSKARREAGARGQKH